MARIGLEQAGVVAGAGMAGVVLVATSPDLRAAPQAAQTAPAQGQSDHPAQPRPDVSLFSQPGDDPPRPFVPLRAPRLKIATRPSPSGSTRRPALEDRGSYADAVALLQQAEKLDPGSLAILRRLSRIYIGAWVALTWPWSSARRS